MDHVCMCNNLSKILMSQVVLSAEAISLDNTDQNRDQYEQQTSQVALLFGSQSENSEPMVYHQLV